MSLKVKTAGLTALVVPLILSGAVACSASGQQKQPAAAFLPSGAASSAGGTATASAASAASAAGYAMPPFGKNAHVDMTSYEPANPDQAAAVNADKDFQLAYLYAEYKGGQDSSWTNYVAPVAQSSVQRSLSSSAVTTESFTGTIKFFDMSITPDPVTKGGYYVLSCFDTAGEEVTNFSTGAVISGTSTSDQSYARLSDVLLKDPGTGQWQVVSSFPAVYYPKAPECKP